MSSSWKSSVFNPVEVHSSGEDELTVFERALREFSKDPQTFNRKVFQDLHAQFWLIEAFYAKAGTDEERRHRLELLKLILSKQLKMQFSVINRWMTPAIGVALKVVRFFLLLAECYVLPEKLILMDQCPWLERREREISILGFEALYALSEMKFKRKTYLVLYYLDLEDLVSHLSRRKESKKLGRTLIEMDMIKALIRSEKTLPSTLNLTKEVDQIERRALEFNRDAVAIFSTASTEMVYSVSPSELAAVRQEKNPSR